MEKKMHGLFKLKSLLNCFKITSLICMWVRQIVLFLFMLICSRFWYLYKKNNTKKKSFSFKANCWLHGKRPKSEKKPNKRERKMEKTGQTTSFSKNYKFGNIYRRNGEHVNIQFGLNVWLRRSKYNQWNYMACDVESRAKKNVFRIDVHSSRTHHLKCVKAHAHQLTINNNNKNNNK